jgi:hypothetical protein
MERADQDQVVVLVDLTLVVAVVLVQLVEVQH